MRRRRRWAAWAAAALLLVLAVGLWRPWAADPQLAAGAMTVRNRTSAAFEQPAGGLTPAELRRHAEADLLFDRAHVPLASGDGAGLGPQFIANSCIACHVRNGRGRVDPTESLVRIALRQGGGASPVPGFGSQVQNQAVLGAEPESEVRLLWSPGPALPGAPPLRQPEVLLSALPPSRVARSLRLAPPLLGMGLLEAIPEAAITARADPEDRDGDGISGRPHWIEAPGQPRRLGRFGWKAISPTVREQTAAAYRHDMGLTTPLTAERELAADGRPADISNRELGLVTYYSETLGAPRTARAASSPVVRQGQRLFAQLQCARCHVPQQQSGQRRQAVVAALNGQTIWPYTDLLLHDMGPGLDDGVAELGARSAEWRTAPLWGLGLTQVINPQATFLHDGRARSLEEAIAWHGGEAQASRDRYLALPARQRAALLRWLRQL